MGQSFVFPEQKLMGIHFTINQLKILVLRADKQGLSENF